MYKRNHNYKGKLYLWIRRALWKVFSPAFNSAILIKPNLLRPSAR